MFCTQVRDWVALGQGVACGVYVSVEKNKRVARQFAVNTTKKRIGYWTDSLNKEDYGVDTYGVHTYLVLLALQKQSTLFCISLY